MGEYEPYIPEEDNDREERASEERGDSKKMSRRDLLGFGMIAAANTIGSYLHTKNNETLAQADKNLSQSQSSPKTPENPGAEYEEYREVIADLRKELGHLLQSYYSEGLPKREWVNKLAEKFQEAIAAYEESMAQNRPRTEHWDKAMEGLVGGAIVGAAAESVLHSEKLEHKLPRRGFLAAGAGYAGAFGAFLKSKYFSKGPGSNAASFSARLAAIQSFDLIPSEQTKELPEYPPRTPRANWSDVARFIEQWNDVLEDCGLADKLAKYAVAHAEIVKKSMGEDPNQKAEKTQPPM